MRSFLAFLDPSPLVLTECVHTLQIQGLVRERRGKIAQTCRDAFLAVYLRRVEKPEAEESKNSGAMSEHDDEAEEGGPDAMEDDFLANHRKPAKRKRSDTKCNMLKSPDEKYYIPYTEIEYERNFNRLVCRQTAFGVDQEIMWNAEQYEHVPAENRARLDE
jgi:hypothetical protein